MKIFIIGLIGAATMLTACSPSEEATNEETSDVSTYEETSNSTEEEASSEVENVSAYEQPQVETYTEEKINFCSENDDVNACYCQFDVIDPLLTVAIGNDWSTKSMEEKDFPAYVSAVEAAVAQCA